MGIASMRHPVTNAIYTDVLGDVKVELNGRCGLFRRNGQWLSGELRSADPMMCIWIAGHNYGDSVPFRNQRLQEEHGAGWRPAPADGTTGETRHD